MTARDPTDPAATPERMPGWVEGLVRLLDDGWRIPGTPLRFGLDAVLGFLLPGVGDALTSTGSIALIVVALKRGVPRVVLLRMLLNIVLDTVLGAVPLLGDGFDVVFKSNRRNLALLERASTSPRPARRLDYVVVALAAAFVLGLAALPFVLFVWALRRG